jgi:hypothetical protein
LGISTTTCDLSRPFPFEGTLSSAFTAVREGLANALFGAAGLAFFALGLAVGSFPSSSLVAAAFFTRGLGLGLGLAVIAGLGARTEELVNGGDGDWSWGVVDCLTGSHCSSSESLAIAAAGSALVFAFAFELPRGQKNENMPAIVSLN